jgi:predicted RNase H-like nuclease
MKPGTETPKIAGADGCRSGWVVAYRNGTGPIDARICQNTREMISQLVPGCILCMDVPIGLSEMGPRQADREARQRLGWPRMTSVFSAPIRPVLECTTWEEASAIRRAVEGKGMSRQAWGITPKVREVDQVVRELDPRQKWIREAHPEVSFATWAGNSMLHNKKSISGRQERRLLIDREFGEGTVARLWDGVRGKGLARDDLIDALAMLWTADRVASGHSGTLPQEAQRDSFGLRMEIVY